MIDQGSEKICSPVRGVLVVVETEAVGEVVDGAVECVPCNARVGMEEREDGREQTASSSSC